MLGAALYTSMENAGEITSFYCDGRFEHIRLEKEKFEDTQGIIRSRQLKDIRQHCG